MWSSLFYEVVWNVGEILSALSSLVRIESLLLEKDQTNQLRECSQPSTTSESTISEKHSIEEKNDPPASSVSVYIRDAMIGIASLEKVFVKSVSATVPPGKLSLLCSTAVGVGKTSTLLAILREYDTISGSIKVDPPQEHIAYCSQDAVLQ